MSSKQAWMRLTSDHMPNMKAMELGKRYHVAMEIEPTELSTGEDEYSGMMMGPDGKKGQKPPMSGRFKVHSISESSGGSSSASANKQGGKKKSKKTGRY